jgi:GNAT superfamily N-acetyltransferase
MSLVIRPATADDAGLIVGFIRGLAVYERLEAQAQATEADIVEALTGQARRVGCEIAELDGEPVGFALWFYIYSTFQGRFGLYLEDLFVSAEARGRGVGKALLVALAQRCAQEGLGRMDWSVLDWNTDAIGFYEGLGARLTDEWRGCRLEGEALTALAAQP